MPNFLIFSSCLCYNRTSMDPNQTPPQVGVNSDNVGASATGQSVFANAPNRFKDTTPKGDIIIPPSTPEKPKGPVNKKLIIGIIAAIVVIIVAIVLIVVFSGNKSSSNSTKSSSSSSSSVSTTEDVQAAFNKYANFIISGEASTSRIPSEDELDGYLIVSKIIDHDTEFMDEAKILFDEFYTVFEDTDMEENYLLVEQIDYYRQTFDFLYEYSKSDAQTEDFVAMTDNPLAVAYANAKTAYDDAMKNSAKDKYELLDKVNSIVETAEDDIMFECYSIDNALYGDATNDLAGEGGSDEAN